MKRHFLLLIVLIIIFSFYTLGCQVQDQYDRASIPSPKEGTANILGKIDFLNQDHSEGISVWVTKVYRTASGDGVYALDTSSNPYTLTDENGYFLFEDIEPGEYILFIGDPMTKFEIVTDKNGEAKVWEIIANETNDLGVISIEF